MSLLTNRRFLTYPVLQATLIVCLSLIVNSAILLACNYDPIAAFSALFNGAFGSFRHICEIFVRACPLLLTGLAISFAFRCGMWNIGAEGQYFMGSMVATWVGVTGSNLPPFILLSLILTFGCFAGGIWSAIAGLLKSYRGVQEVISTIMLNYIAFYLLSYIVDGGPLQESAKYYPQSELLNVCLPILLNRTRFHIGILLAIVLAICSYWILMSTTIGYRLRAVGQNVFASQVAGINVPKNITLAMFISGSFAGLAGAMDLIGVSPYRLFQPSGMSMLGPGFIGIAVALLARLNPIGVIFSALLFGGLQVGADAMQLVEGVPAKLTSVIQATVLLLVLGFAAIEQKSSISIKTDGHADERYHLAN